MKNLNTIFILLIAILVLITCSCPNDMADFGTYCMDRYEAPNKPGEHPLYFVTAYEGEKWCQERGKRLCTEKEWLNTCTGNGLNLPYPYGSKYIEHICNDDKQWKPVDWNKLGKYPAQEAIDEAKRLYQVNTLELRVANRCRVKRVEIELVVYQNKVYLI